MSVAFAGAHVVMPDGISRATLLVVEGGLIAAIEYEIEAAGALSGRACERIGASGVWLGPRD